jgi:hypothetical protein
MPFNKIACNSDDAFPQTVYFVPLSDQSIYFLEHWARKDIVFLNLYFANFCYLYVYGLYDASNLEHLFT